MTRIAIIILSLGTLISLISITVEASMVRNVFAGGAAIWELPWGKATLIDAYYGFGWFYLVIFYRESSVISRIIWAILTLCLGSMAASLYLLIFFLKAPADVTLSDFFKPVTRV